MGVLGSVFVMGVLLRERREDLSCGSWLRIGPRPAAVFVGFLLPMQNSPLPCYLFCLIGVCAQKRRGGLEAGAGEAAAGGALAQHLETTKRGLRERRRVRSEQAGLHRPAARKRVRSRQTMLRAQNRPGAHHEEGRDVDGQPLSLVLGPLRAPLLGACMGGLGCSSTGTVGSGSSCALCLVAVARWGIREFYALADTG